MSKTVEIKVAEQLVNLTDDHWFNPLSSVDIWLTSQHIPLIELWKCWLL